VNLDYSSDDVDFRRRARAWLADRKPTEPRPVDSSAAEAFDRAWQRKLYEGGFAGISWPKDFGGAGLTLIQQMIWYEEVARAQAPALNAMGIAVQHAGPTLIARGNEAQKAFHLPRILRGESIWCQGFSEPGAGSDLAALTTRGEVVGNEIVVNGQKMWTSYGHLADFQELLVRTEAGSKRHQGLTWVICDMRSPGITVEPIVNMMGEHHVNTVFYDDVRIPLTNVVGGLGGGWGVAMSTLSVERVMSFLPDQVELLEKVDLATQLASKLRLESGQLAIDDVEISRRLARIKAEALALRAMTIGNLAKLDRGTQPGVEGSIMKLAATTLYKSLSILIADIIGMRFLEYGADRTSNRWTYEFMWSWVLTISGGSSEIQRDVIADRFLGLPRGR
jgi:alkylation response protein AidB-like acyl-CoA dehydrogenase